MVDSLSPSGMQHLDRQVMTQCTRAHRRAESKPLDEAGDRHEGQFTERDFCQKEAASDVISGKGEKGDQMNACTNFGDCWTTKSLEA